MEARKLLAQTEMMRLLSITNKQRIYYSQIRKEIPSFQNHCLESINVSIDIPHGGFEPARGIEEWSMGVGSHESEFTFVAGDRGFLTLSYMVYSGKE